MWPGHQTNRDQQVVDCQIEQLVVLCTSFLASPKLEFIASFRGNKSEHLSKRYWNRNDGVLINGLAQILNILHEIDGTIGQSLCCLSVGEDAHKLQDGLVLA